MDIILIFGINIFIALITYLNDLFNFFEKKRKEKKDLGNNKLLLKIYFKIFSILLYIFLEV